MINAIILLTVLNVGEVSTLPPEKSKIEARRRNSKGNKKRRRGGNGLR